MWQRFQEKTQALISELKEGEVYLLKEAVKESDILLIIPWKMEKTIKDHSVRVSIQNLLSVEELTLVKAEDIGQF